MAILQMGRYVVETSSEDKLYFPAHGITKGDLIDYYRRIAEVMLPYLRGRPLTLHRFPDGLSGKGFFQQNVPDYFPDWIDRVSVESGSGTGTRGVCNEAAALVYLANQSSIALHAWASRRSFRAGCFVETV